MKNTTKETWQEDVLDQDLVLVDFWASWCAPCKMMNPILEQLDIDIAKLNVVKVDADSNAELVAEWSVISIPTLLLFKQGELVVRMTGAKPRGVLLEKIVPYI